MSSYTVAAADDIRASEHAPSSKENVMPHSRGSSASLAAPQPPSKYRSSIGTALTDTPATTAPNSPRMPPSKYVFPEFLIEIMLKSSQSNVWEVSSYTIAPKNLDAAKADSEGTTLTSYTSSSRKIVYVTKKISRYLNWLQHDTRIFNVGERRRVAARGSSRQPTPAKPTNGFRRDFDFRPSVITGSLNGILNQKTVPGSPTLAPGIRVNGRDVDHEGANDLLPPPAMDTDESACPESHRVPPDGTEDSLSKRRSIEALRVNTDDQLEPEVLEQTADFFDPENTKAAHIREQVAEETLDELLDYILEQGGSVGIFDATNSTLKRRQMIMKRIRERAGPELGVLFLESICFDEQLLESNMRLKLSGPDYKDQDPVTALADFRKRRSMYEKTYVPVGEYEERHNQPYVQMIDVGRKIVSHRIQGFLSAQTVYYLLNFNLSPRQIWITRHGESLDNLNGKIGGDSVLSTKGEAYAKALTMFMRHERQMWDVRQEDKARFTHFPPIPGDVTPPNPDYSRHGEGTDGHTHSSFCVWTSMLKRSIQTAQYFDEEEFEIKQMRMLDELNAGAMEGMTYEEIKMKYKHEYELRKKNKIAYRYPGAGGESYLDIINRLRAVIVEVERMTDHVLLVGHRSVARVLLAYFKGLNHEDIADLDVPLGMLYMLEPKPYGVDFKAYRYHPETDWFHLVPDYELRRAASQHE
ncbi:hypothetical protein MMC34_006600 [Xylographa carneopallida]|nr:hypothetical protein [Xylographa carneopallida]